MCGIAGFVGCGDIDDLRRMSKAISHRGPDESTEWVDQSSSIYLAHRRLSIIDIDHGSQPMWTQDSRLCIIFNGEIYNHKELRHKLIGKGHVFRTDHSDTEVLLHGYREWGQDLVEHLDGMWAFCIYDIKNGVLFLSRDRFGEKPLFYAHGSTGLIFSSELGGLLKHSHINPQNSMLALQKYYAYGFIPSPLTLYDGVRKLPPGHNIIYKITSNTYLVRKYWSLGICKESNDNVSIDKASDNIIELLSDSIKLRMRSDVPMGSFLSGGIDSSIVSRLASDISGSTPINTFSIGFSDNRFDETRYSDLVSELIGSKHRSQVIGIEDLHQYLPRITGMYTDTIADSSIIPTYVLCEFASKHIKVAMGGDGADELLAGYAPFHALKMANYYSKLTSPSIHRAILSLSYYIPTSLGYLTMDFKIKRFLKGLSYDSRLWNPVWLGPLDSSEIRELFSSDISVENLYEEAIIAWESCESNSLIDKTLAFYYRYYLPDNILTKTDIASMRNGLELRSPFLEKNLVEYITKLPDNYKYRSGVTKYVLRQAAKNILPDSILKRSKRGFALPVGQWFKDGLIDINNDHAGVGYNTSLVRKYYDGHVSGKADNRLFLWAHRCLNASLQSNA